MILDVHVLQGAVSPRISPNDKVTFPFVIASKAPLGEKTCTPNSFDKVSANNEGVDAGRHERSSRSLHCLSTRKLAATAREAAQTVFSTRMCCDYPVIWELRAQCSAAGGAEAGKRAKFTGLPTAAFPTCHRVSSFFDSGTRAASISLTLRASATGCAPIFCAANLTAR